jgi:2-C-methyl-D-erythritol 4-phosphate cytidylyltransferase
LDHTLSVFIELDFVDAIYVAISAGDEYFPSLRYATHHKVTVVEGGKERADSVLNGLNQLVNQSFDWVMVHDAARPCVLAQDIAQLYKTCIEQDSAGILASPVRDTMKRGNGSSQRIDHTVDRTDLWHGLTPQCAKVEQLHSALTSQLDEQQNMNPAVTDEASALEMSGIEVMIVEGSASNIKITHPDDLQLAGFYLSQNRGQS